MCIRPQVTQVLRFGPAVDGLGDVSGTGEAKGTGTGLSAEDQLGVHGMYVVGRRHGMRLDDFAPPAGGRSGLVILAPKTQMN